MSRPLLVLAIALAATLPSCVEREVGRHRVPPPAAFAPERFPDLPIPPGFVPLPTERQLAVSYAGGALRRYQAVFREVNEDGPLPPAKATEWYGRRLPESGWILVDQRGWRQLWRKERDDGRFEELEVETGRDDRRTIIRLALDAAPAAEGAQQPQQRR